VDLVKIFATYLCFQVLGGFFYVWDKKVVEMFIQDEIVPVLCLCGVTEQGTGEGGWMPS